MQTKLTPHVQDPEDRANRVERVAGVMLLGAGIFLPFFIEDYRVFQLSNLLAFAIALLGLNLLIGLSGQISLGHGAFMALGAYVGALSMLRLGLPYGVAIPLATAVCFVFGVVVGIPALRFAGHYLALCTFALAVAIPQLLKSKVLEKYSGGVGGQTLPKPPVPLGLPISQDQWLYFLGLTLFIVTFLFVRNLANGRIGRALVALRDHPTAAACMGVDIAHYKILAFGVAAGCAGLSGAFWGILIQFVAPDSFTIMLSISLLVGAVVGGLNRPIGALLGAAFIQYVPDLAESFSKSAPWAIYAVFVILTAIALPSGLAGLVRMGLVRMTRRPPMVANSQASTSAALIPQQQELP